MVAGVLSCSAEMHSRRMPHGDLKPGNTLCSRTGCKPECKLCNFDSLMRMVHTNGCRILRKEAGGGSPGLVAPERLAQGASFPGDIFFAGAVAAAVLLNYTW